MLKRIFLFHFLKTSINLKVTRTDILNNLSVFVGNIAWDERRSYGIYGKRCLGWTKIIQYLWETTFWIRHWYGLCFYIVSCRKILSVDGRTWFTDVRYQLPAARGRVSQHVCFSHHWSTRMFKVPWTIPHWANIFV